MADQDTLIILEGKNMDILEEYENLVKRHLDAPEVFIKASAYHLVSSLMGRFFRCPHIPGHPGLGCRPNTWFIISSIPGRTRRSTVANYATSVYKRSLSTFFQETIPEWANAHEANKKVLDSIIEEGTPEGITDHINISELDAYTIMSSEFGAVLTRINTKDSEVGVSSLLSKLYYGEGGSMMLSQRTKTGKEFGKRYIPEGLYVTMFAGMQEPHYYLSPIMIRQGLLRRIMLVYADPSDIERWLPPIQTARGSVYEELFTPVTHIVEKMKEYKDYSQENNPQYIDTSFHPSAERFINRYSKENDDKLKEEVNNFNIYMQGYWEHLTKISMLHAISRDAVRELPGGMGTQLVVSKQDCEKAQEFLDRATKYSRDIISNLSRVDVPIQSAQAPLERVFSVISEAGSTGIQRKDLYRKTNMTARGLQEILNTLLLQERIQKDTLQSTGGRCPTIYKVRTD